MVELRYVRHRYDGRVVLDFEQFALSKTGIVGLVGHNGAGKSTLLRMLALLEAPTEGFVLWEGNAVKPRQRAALRRRVTLVEQRPVLFRGTVRENLEYGLRARDIRHAAAHGMVGDVVDRLGLSSLLNRRRHELSDGEVQRVAVARALVLRTDVLLLDEPASSADRAAAGALYRALAAERAERPFAACIASHQLEDAYRWANDIRVLVEGRLSSVSPENLFRVELPAGEGVKQARVGNVDFAVMTDRNGPVVLAIPPTDIFVSRELLASSARNVLRGRVVGMSIELRGAGVQVRADVGGVELIATITAEAARELALGPGSPVVFSFKATAVRVF
ncbi:MAG TPA: ATP-binding cassette domain-containing protein [Gemmatimonadales bacterium]|nr:ATP-binding cassette domain-containing protein [Gemmatimonadales bacterium]